MDLGISGLENAEPIGQGGFATVYKAQQPAFARTVAVKVLSEAHDDDDIRSRVEREFRALGMLSEHPGITTVHATGVTPDGHPYLIMSFVGGGTLADRLEAQGALPWPEAVAATIRLAGALETAHWSGIIHSDVRPANVLLTQDDDAQLTDFGIARIGGERRGLSNAATASIAHVAPEVLDGSRSSVAADVYSLGSTASAMLLGRPTFEPSTDEAFDAFVLRIRTETPPDLRATRRPRRPRCTARDDAGEGPGGPAGFGTRVRAAVAGCDARPRAPCPGTDPGARGRCRCRSLEEASGATSRRAPGHRIRDDPIRRSGRCRWRFCRRPSRQGPRSPSASSPRSHRDRGLLIGGLVGAAIALAGDDDGG